MECAWLKGLPPERLKNRFISITLAIKQPESPVKKIEEKKQDISPIRPDPPKTPKKKKGYRSVLKSKQQKINKATAPPIKQDILKVITDVKPEPSNGFEQIEMETIPQETAKKEITAPASKTINEARPLYQTNPPPKYPAMARKRGYTGNVVLEVLVGRNGEVVDLRVFASSGHAILDKGAITSVEKWTFEPGMRGEEKVNMWVRVPIRFELK